MAGRFRAADDPWLNELRAFCYDIERLIEWGEVDLQTRQGDYGRAWFERVVALAPENPRGYERLGACYLASGQPARAVEIFERGSGLPGAGERLFALLCDAYHAQRNPAGELRAAERGLLAWPGTSTLHNGRAHALAGLRRFDEAIAEYQFAVASAPFAADPVANLGDALLQAGRREEAKAAYRRALALQPLYPKALGLLADLEIEDDELTSAGPRVLALLSQEPDAPGVQALVVRWHVKAARAAIRQNAFDDAEKACRVGLALVPDAVELAGMLSAILVQRDRAPEAVAVLEVVHAHRPEDARMTLALGEIYGRVGRPAEARRLLDEGVAAARRSGDSELAERGVKLLHALATP